MYPDIFKPDVFFYLMIISVVYFSTWFVGRTIFLLVATKAISVYELNFFSLLSGFMAIVTLYAIFITGADTVLLLSLFAAIYIFIRRFKYLKNPFSKIKKDEFGALIVVYGVFLFVFAAHYYLFFIRSGGEIFADFNWYGNITNGLVRTGVESMSWFAQNTAPTVYHYGDIWITTFWAELFGANHVHVILLITNTILLSLLLIGAFVLFTQLTANKIVISVFLTLLLLIFNPISTFIFSYQLQILSHPKFYITSVFLIAFAIYFFRNEFTKAFFVLILLVPFNTLMSPGVLSALFFFSIYKKYKSESFGFRTFINEQTLLSLFFLVFLVVFYGLRPRFSEQSIDFIPLYENGVLHAIEMIFREMAYALLRLLPSIALLFLLLRLKVINKSITSKYFDFNIFVFIGAFFSAITAGIFSVLYIDGPQLAVNYNAIVVGFAVFVSLVYILNEITKIKTFKYFSIITLVLLFSVNIFFIDTIVYPKSKPNIDEVQFYNLLKNEFEAEKPVNFGYYRNYAVPENFNTPASRLRMILPLNKIVHIIPDGFYAPLCLSVFDIPDNVIPKFDERRNALLVKYENKIQKQGISMSRDSAILSFIDDMKINYIIFEKNALMPIYLSEKEIIAEFDGNRVIRM